MSYKGVHFAEDLRVPGWGLQISSPRSIEGGSTDLADVLQAYSG